MPFREYNFDGLVGPTHNYAGLGTGNLASMASKHHVSSPKAAALEGLAKMKLLAEMGVPQAILPPQRRPHMGYLWRRYTGRNAGVPPAPDGAHSRQDACVTSEQPTPEAAAIAAPVDWISDRPKIAKVAALLRGAAENGEEGRRDLAIASSASAMWAANAATVSPSPDTADGRLHITPANLASQPHRALEAAERYAVLATIFGDMRRFDVHPPLPRELPDEGAANHTRFCSAFGTAGTEVFTYGRRSEAMENSSGERFRPRQSEEASNAVIDQHGVPWETAVTVRQTPAMIDAGVFHNDVIAVGNQRILLIASGAWHGYDRKGIEHEQRFCIDEIRNALAFASDERTLHVIEFAPSELSLADAVRSYLFNSQLVTLPDGSMALIHPAECDEVPTARAAIERILREDNPIEHAVRVDVRQSMKNGGGPACLRLRVVLSDEERRAVRGNVFWTPQLHETLIDWVNRHYRDTLTPQDLADVRLYEESMAALDELAEIMQLPI